MFILSVIRIHPSAGYASCCRCWESGSLCYIRDEGEEREVGTIPGSHRGGVWKDEEIILPRHASCSQKDTGTCDMWRTGEKHMERKWERKKGKQKVNKDNKIGYSYTIDFESWPSTAISLKGPYKVLSPCLTITYRIFNKKYIINKIKNYI